MKGNKWTGNKYKERGKNNTPRTKIKKIPMREK